MTSKRIYCSSAIGIDIEKASVDYVDISLDTLETLDADRYNYLLKRHGSEHLDPLPSCYPLDPLNRPDREKNFESILIAFQSFSSSFMVAGFTLAYESTS